MPTAIELLGSMNTDFEGFALDVINGVAIDKTSFQNFVISALKAYENDGLALGV